MAYIIYVHLLPFPRVTLPFDLLTPKVNHFVPLPRGPLVPIFVKIGPFVFHNIVFAIR